jgi:hypothetical protein
MANCPPIQPGLVACAYDRMTDGRPIVFDHYVCKDFQAAAIRAELIELTNVLDAERPPWSSDKTAAEAVFRRKIPNFGTIWYTFILIGRRRCLLVLTGTCEGFDDGKKEVRKARQKFAERRVEEFRREGPLCC